MLKAVIPIAKFCERLHCSRQTAYAKHHRGEITIVKIGGRAFIRESEYERIVDEAAAVPRRAPTDSRAA
ncbi:MAG: helix-turn-helix domain-containing protein [Beijerinckiaceae bacterium]|nr:helix-turn-helix domain-containing protein [Beijerinckiaceae bacterium]